MKGSRYTLGLLLVIYVMNHVDRQVMNLVGFGIGPVLLGWLSDTLGGGKEIRFALILLVGFLLWASLHYALGARTYLVDLQAKRDRNRI